MNNAINEIKNTLEATNSRITEAEDRISEFEVRMVEINESERINEKRIKRNEHNLRDLQDNIKRYNIRIIGVPEEEDKKKDLTIVYAQTGIKYVKLYGPSVALCAASLACIIKSHDIMRKRNMALAAAYTAVDKAYKEYRGRIVERLGKEFDYEVLHNVKAQQVEEVVVDEKTGKEKVVTETVQVMDPNARSPYSIIWDCGNIGWTKDPEKNKFFLMQQMNFANDKLKAQGHLFLNEVYDMLGAKRTKAGAVVGWIYDDSGDGYVDFGLFNTEDPGAIRFINGHERSVILDFNVQGPIYDLI